MDDFDFSTFNINLIHGFISSFKINIKVFLIEFVSFVKRVEFLLHDLNSPRVSIFVCENTVIITLDTSLCSEAYSRMLRRKIGLNALETLPLLKKISLTLDKIVFFVEPELY